MTPAAHLDPVMTFLGDDDNRAGGRSPALTTALPDESMPPAPDGPEVTGRCEVINRAGGGGPPAPLDVDDDGDADDALCLLDPRVLCECCGGALDADGRYCFRSEAPEAAARSSGLLGMT